MRKWRSPEIPADDEGAVNHQNCDSKNLQIRNIKLSS